MKDAQLRKELLDNINLMQEKGFSYQFCCDYINAQQNDFILFKDFFTRFKSKSTFYAGPAKRKKLALIHQYLQQLIILHISEEDTIKDFINKVISKAVAAKFEAYLDINRSTRSYRTLLAEYYLEDRPAFLEIEGNIKHKKQYKWELDLAQFGSSFKILSIETINLFQQNAVVTTQEFWKLYWVDCHSKKLQFKFDTLGEHTYLLSKEETGHWLIMENAEKIPIYKTAPPYIDYSILKQLPSKNREKNRKTVADFLSDRDLFRAIEFIKICYADTLAKNQLSLLNRIKESCLHSYRILNTNVINFATFSSEIELLRRQLQLIHDGILINNK